MKKKWKKDLTDLLEPNDIDEKAEKAAADEIEIKIPDEDSADQKVELKEEASVVVEKPEEIPKEEEKETETSKEKELYDRLIRIAADFDNYKKRVQKEKSEFLNYANERLIKETLPILDNLERGYESMKSTSDLSSILAGVELIINQFKAVLKKEGVEAVESKGKDFDPMIHEAISQTPSNDHPPNTVIFEESKAYFLNNKLLRPAKVVVSKSLESKDEDKNEEESREIGSEAENEENAK